MPTKLPHTDVVIIGLGWTGAILAHELTQAGLRVTAIERGPWRDTATDFSINYIQDELRYAVHHDLFLRPQQETLTFRNNSSQTALPVRSWGSFMPGNGVGGAGVHWNGQHWRFLPTDFTVRSHLTERYGAKFLPEDMTIQDWGVTYDELEPFYQQFEDLCGTSGKAGNLEGRIVEGGNPFEGPRSKEYPNPPLRRVYSTVLFDKAARDLGYHPFPAPASNTSRPYTNPLGVEMGECSYCGFCEWFGCANYSKASPQTTVLPVLVHNPNFTARTESVVTRINLDGTGRRATGVTFVDVQGREWEQPADLVLVCGFSIWNVHMLLVSGIGTAYDPKTGKGTVGRNYAYQTDAYVHAFFDDKNLNPFVGAGALGQMLDDFNGDNFDHSQLGFVGGAFVGVWNTNGRPITHLEIPQGTPTWGAGWKQAAAKYYLRQAPIEIHGSSYSYRDCYLDLDPTYKDPYGRPLLRMTFDFHDNERRMSKYITDKAADVARAMGASMIHPKPRTGHYTIEEYQTTHNVGGTAMGTDPSTSVVNRYLQCWDVPNVFIPGGASVFPQNHGYNPTGTVGALAFWAAKAIREQYLKSPGPLMHA